MKNKIVGILVMTLLITSNLTFFKAEIVSAEEPQEDPPINEWIVDGNNTYFEVKNSSYLNITLTSTENVQVHLKSIPKVISYHIERNCTANSTEITLSGFEASKTYYMYEDCNLTSNFTTDENGSYSYLQDLTTYHHIFIQETTSTITIDADGNIIPIDAPIQATQGGVYWLTDDVDEPIIIECYDITFYGNGYKLKPKVGFEYTAPGITIHFDSWGQEGVTIKNLEITGFSIGVWSYFSHNNKVINCNLHNNSIGTYAERSNYFKVKNCEIQDNTIGMEFYYSHWSNVKENVISTNREYGVYIHHSSYFNTITGNTISRNHPYGVYISRNCYYNTISYNRVHHHSYGILLYGNMDNQYNTITGNTISYNSRGLTNWVYGYTYNMITFNTISNNNIGIYQSNALHDRFHHNDIIDNTYQVYGKISLSYCYWDDGYGEGNYWSDYTGVDDGSNGRTAGDGIGDTLIPHPYTNQGNRYYRLDNYPLMFAWNANDPPIADAGGPYSANQGEMITLNASDSSDPNEDPLQYRWDFRNDGTWDTSYSTDPTVTHAYYYAGWIKVEVFDGVYTDTAMSYVTVSAESRTYTVDADFDEGILVRLEHETVHDQLQLYELNESYPTLWIANSGEDTISKWDTNTNKEIARYHTWFGPPGNHGSWEGPSPSRTCVDSDGNCYVANRHFDGRPADVIKILTDDWIDRNGNGVLDTSYDANGDTTITSDEMLPMTDLDGDNVIDDNEIVDERIAWAVSIGPNNGCGRALAIDMNGNIWLGLYNSMTYYKLSSEDGSILAGPIHVWPHRPYGALVDAYGILWGVSNGVDLLKLDTNTSTKLNIYDHSKQGSNYGIALGYDDEINTLVYLGSDSGYTYIEFNSSSETFSRPAETFYAVYGIATDSMGNIIAGHAGTGSVSKFAPDGSLIWSASAQVASEVRGTAVDNNDDIWLIHRGKSKLSKFNGTNGSPLGVFNSGKLPYTYSDAAGSGFKIAYARYGTWDTIFDCGTANTSWGKVSWNSYEPDGTSVTVMVRSSHDQNIWSSWETANNGISLNLTPDGRYLQIKTILENISGDSLPILYDLTVEIADINAPPIANANGPYEADEGEIITFNASVSSDPDDDPLQYRWDFDNDGVWDTDYSTDPTASYTWDDDYTGTIAVEVYDGELTDTATASVTVNNVAPTADAGIDQVGDEPSTFIFTGTHTDPGTNDTHTYEWDFDYDGVTFDIDATGNNISHTWEDDFDGTVALRVIDDDGGWHIDTCNVTVNNVAPTITSFSLPIVPLQIGTAVDLTASFTDPGLLDTHTATIDWGDGNVSSGTITGSGGTYTVTDSWSYGQAGVYIITLTVEDDDGGSDTNIFQYMVVYDPSAGFVTGGGWIMSPEGAYTPDPNLTGKANFGFVSKYKKGQTTPSGNTQFHFKVADMNFHSNDYDWLVIANAKAMYKGTGTINNAGNYGFMLSAIDEELTPNTDIDLFRIKIWDKDNNNEVIYDNQLGDDDDADPIMGIDGGQIKIHEG